MERCPTPTLTPVTCGRWENWYKLMRVRELPLQGQLFWVLQPCTLPGKHSRTGPGGKGLGKVAWGCESYSIGWGSQAVLEISPWSCNWESCLVDQLSFHPGSNPGLCTDPPHYLPQAWAAGVCERANLADPKLQDNHDSGYNRIPERNPSEDQVLIVHSRSQRSRTRPMTHCNEHLQGKMCG